MLGNPWFLRGHDFPLGTGSGVFAYNNAHGSIWSHGSFRELTKIKKVWIIDEEKIWIILEIKFRFEKKNT